MDREVRSTLYRYLLDLEIDGSDRSHLIDALEDEEFPLRELLGEKAMVEQIQEGELKMDVTSEKPIRWFAKVIEVLSVHLSEYVIGLELAEGRNAEGTRVQVEVRKYAGRMGEVIAVPLEHKIEFPSGDITPLEEDVKWLEGHFSELPRWAQDAYRIKFPQLRRL